MSRLSPTVRGLALCQGLLLTNNAMLTSVNGLAGLLLAPDPRIATLPVTIYVLGGALATLPMSLGMQRRGRGFGFALGCFAAMAGSLIAASGVAWGSFTLLCLGTLLFGIYNASGQYFRFAAVDVSAEPLRARALSFVLAGGLIGAFLGPALSRITVDAAGSRFMGTYLALIALAVVVLIVTRLLRLPLPASGAVAPHPPARLGDLLQRPGFVLAIVASACAWASMNLLMTATPLAMRLCGYPFGDAAFVLQWHMVGMYAPMLITGRLIERFGAIACIAAGAVLTAGCTAIALSGESVTHFASALSVLGTGWALLFAGGSALLTRQYAAHEKGLAQGVHDACMFGAMTLSSLGAGFMMARESWHSLQFVALPLIATALIATLVWGRGAHRAEPAAGL
jgi:MFS family permease